MGCPFFLRDVQQDGADNPRNVRTGKARTLRLMTTVHPTPMNEIQKFSEADLSSLRDGLRQSGLDSLQWAELLMAFLTERGYGASSDEARNAARRIEPLACTLPRLQEELERLAWVM